MEREQFLKQYQTKEWYEISKRIKARDNNTCQMCGCNNKPLAVHHLYYPSDGNICNVDDDSLITLCEDCHTRMHYYNDFFGIIGDLKAKYSSYEIHSVLSSMHNGFKVKKTRGKKVLYLEIIDEDFDDDNLNISFLDNLYKWRKRISDGKK